MSTQDCNEAYEIDEVERVSHAFMNYQVVTKNIYAYSQKLMSNANVQQHEKLLKAGMKDYYEKLSTYADANQKVLKRILEFNLNSFYGSNDTPMSGIIKTLRSDYDRITSMLSSIGTEWSNEGKTRRNKMWSLLLKDLNQKIEVRTKKFNEDKQVHIVVPGAGAGRLPYEILQLNSNVRVTSNEEDINLYFANNYILDESTHKNANVIYPNIHDLVSRLSCTDATKTVSFPDVDTGDNKSLEGRINTYPENFNQICEEQLEAESVDCVVTWFFLETAKNAIEYIEQIEKILKPDGFWINMGGLQYMYEPYESVSSIEMAYKDLKGAIVDAGLIIERETLIENYEYFLDDSDVKRIYKCPYFTCIKGGVKCEFNKTIDLQNS